jgi:hypothetical protein
MQIFNKVTASMAINIGKEEVVYGAAIQIVLQIFNCLKTGGEMLEGGL